MRNLTEKLGAVEGSEDDLMKAFEFEKELAKVSRVVLVSSPPSFFYFSFLYYAFCPSLSGNTFSLTRKYWSITD